MVSVSVDHVDGHTVYSAWTGVVYGECGIKVLLAHVRFVQVEQIFITANQR